MKRRTFITQSTAVTAGVSLMGNADLWAGANDRIRSAVIGMGGRGGEHMLHSAKLANVEVGAICDPDERRLQKWAGELEKQAGKKTAMETDMRKVMDDKNIDAVVIASCNHWHALAGIWACQAGKHVYVEKPVSHNLFEGRKLVEAVRKYNRISQGGTQRRSDPKFRKAAQLLREGVIGEIYMARAIIFGVRDSIGFKPITTPPPELKWDLWLGPAPEQPYHENLVHYNWHWFWDFGNGEMGNNGSHALDVVRMGLNKGLPNKIYSKGGRFGYQDQAQTPNTQLATFEYADGTIVSCETRGLYTNDEGGLRWGAIFYGSKGYMTAGDDNVIKLYLGRNKNPEPDIGQLESIDHMQNFIDAIRQGKRELLTGEIEEIYLSCALCHLANISYRLGRELHFDPAKEAFIGDTEADRMLTREYRKPFIVPEKV